MARWPIAAGCLFVAGMLPVLGAAADGVPVPFPDISSRLIPPGQAGEQVRSGRRIVVETARWARTYVGNGLSCGSCHLDAGCRPGAIPFAGVTAVYPMYRSRRAQIDTLEDRINDCFERSLAGRPLPVRSPQMRDIVAYMTWLSTGVPAGRRVQGHGVTLLVPTHAANLGQGERRFQAVCAACHGSDGHGTAMAPPLWGRDSFTIGAGMARSRTLAGFIRANMPLGQSGTLSTDDAVDIGAYVLSHDRPDFAAKRDDWPQGGKPADCPY
jgi:thiosulfate dehydrogenase